MFLGRVFGFWGLGSGFRIELLRALGLGLWVCRGMF